METPLITFFEINFEQLQIFKTKTFSETETSLQLSVFMTQMRWTLDVSGLMESIKKQEKEEERNTKGFKNKQL